MRLLVLGGTHFVGLHVVRAALARGHDVTLFNRGRSRPGSFPEAEHLIGDRTADLSALAGRSWDAVFDPSGFYPDVVEATCTVLSGSVGHYTFVSSGASYVVYDGMPLPLTEGSRVRELSDPSDTDLHRNANYGPLKAACEHVLAERFDGPLVSLRPGLIVGPEDLTDRFTYWPRRIAQGGDVLAPGSPDRLIQLLDMRDLATWTLDLAERRESGTFNVSGPPRTVGEVLDACVAMTGSDTRLTWVDEDFLLTHGVVPWTEVPLWMPEPASYRVSRMSAERAYAAGLSPRPLEETIRDTLEWDDARPRPLPRGPVGARYVVETIEPDREREMLAYWRAPARLGQSSP